MNPHAPYFTIITATRNVELRCRACLQLTYARFKLTLLRMRVIAVSTLKAFLESNVAYADAKQSIYSWYELDVINPQTI